MEKVLALIFGVLIFVAVYTGVGLLLAFPLKWAINYVFAPSLIKFIFGVEQVGVVKTFILSLITAFLFKTSQDTK